MKRRRMPDRGTGFFRARDLPAEINQHLRVLGTSRKGLSAERASRELLESVLLYGETEHVKNTIARLNGIRASRQASLLKSVLVQRERIDIAIKRGKDSAERHLNDLKLAVERERNPAKKALLEHLKVRCSREIKAHFG